MALICASPRKTKMPLDPSTKTYDLEFVLDYLKNTCAFALKNYTIEEREDIISRAITYTVSRSKSRPSNPNLFSLKEMGLLYQAVHWEITNFYRAKIRRPVTTVIFDETGKNWIDNTPSNTDLSLVDKDTELNLIYGLELKGIYLNDRQKEWLKLVIVDGIPQTEATEIVGLSRQGMIAALFRAIRKLSPEDQEELYSFLTQNI